MGTPREIYETPGSAFVAGFVGSASVIEGAAARALVGDNGPYSIRPERITILAGDAAPSDPDTVRAHGQVTDVQYHGDGTRVQLQLEAGASILAEVPNVGDQASLPRPGAKVTVGFRRSDMLSLHQAEAADADAHRTGEAP